MICIFICKSNSHIKLHKWFGHHFSDISPRKTVVESYRKKAQRLTDITFCSFKCIVWCTVKKFSKVTRFFLKQLSLVFCIRMESAKEFNLLTCWQNVESIYIATWPTVVPVWTSREIRQEVREEGTKIKWNRKERRMRPWAKQGEGPRDLNTHHPASSLKEHFSLALPINANI